MAWLLWKLWLVNKILIKRYKLDLFKYYRKIIFTKSTFLSFHYFLNNTIKNNVDAVIKYFINTNLLNLIKIIFEKFVLITFKFYFFECQIKEN